MADHFVNLHIINNTDIEFTTPADPWFDSGRMDDNQDTTIPKQGKVTIPFYPDGAGVSGYLTWLAYDDVSVSLCIAFSNPLIGHNKLDIAVIDDRATTGKELWDDMDHHDYQSFDKDLNIGGGRLKAHCICTGGGTNDATITLENES
ncbi:MAG: hypothetical protein KZQ66_16245 [Candidatus Thiodiazotropha sp. (ex Lucinoma aequizonata)]|nr:hypothetical protein [Candidatus Thiodiazotropha sp. (ex Lucinoma aequizonata)]MCU7888760.1 hypothetical protein [Candidatus Thiodiazotropha sp. (ex Lucinoma aequizonata)]MCU7894268.1 hypothetical protein [Candidatus Thiodiazotropha sp. (ex Lucinoma aequizonata)]MCU7897736.1 hypothetical protein [Candidatus Thiodiazotropha sp. (ex Lucinoma aequizonata)]MCU7903350.1 hypothetical protein [Candidatus Thiodiazotropha sp. (ex Lucinoma aequizonata)]